MRIMVSMLSIVLRLMKFVIYFLLVICSVYEIGCEMFVYWVDGMMLVVIVVIVMYSIVYIVSDVMMLIGKLCFGFFIFLVVDDIVLKLMNVKNIMVVVLNMLF